MRTAAVKLSAPVKADSKAKKKAAWNYKNNVYFLLKILFAVSGFIIAALVNTAFPQKAAVDIKNYVISAFSFNISLTMNDAYILYSLLWQLSTPVQEYVHGQIRTEEKTTAKGQPSDLRSD